MAAMQTPRHVLAIGPVMAALVKQAMAGARLELAAPGQEAQAALSAGIDLVLIDTDAIGADVARGLIEAVSRRADPPAVLLVGAHLPAGLVRALL